jgi:hypothetical protein
MQITNLKSIPKPITPLKEIHSIKAPVQDFKSRQIGAGQYNFDHSLLLIGLPLFFI